MTETRGAAGNSSIGDFSNSSCSPWYDAFGDRSACVIPNAQSVTGKPPVSVTQVTPIARLTSEYNVFVLPENSPFKTMKDVVEQLKKDPGSVKWGGGSRGSTEHIAAAMIAREAGVDAAKINYVPFRGGGEAVAAILGGNVTVGGSGYSEFAQYIESGKMKGIAVTSAQRLKGINIPTLKEQGINVEIGNWRGVYGAAAMCAGTSARPRFAFVVALLLLVLRLIAGALLRLSAQLCGAGKDAASRCPQQRLATWLQLLRRVLRRVDLQCRQRVGLAAHDTHRRQCL